MSTPFTVSLVLQTLLCATLRALPITSFVEENVHFFEGDIILRNGQNPTNSRNFVVDLGLLWPNKTLAYELSDEFASQEKQWIRSALDDLEKATCVRFVSRQEENDYLYVRNTQGCASIIGYHPGRYEMFLQQPGCSRWGTIQHEFLHALGFWHEHTRPDRDRYVQIQWHNVEHGLEINFAVRDWKEAQSEGLPYDYGSVLHYRESAFSRDGTSPTIIPLKNVTRSVIGQREKISRLDLAKLNRLYDCGPPYYLGEDVSPVTEVNSELPVTTFESTSTSTETAFQPTLGDEPKYVALMKKDIQKFNYGDLRHYTGVSSSSETGSTQGYMQMLPSISKKTKQNSKLKLKTANSYKYTARVKRQVGIHYNGMPALAHHKLRTKRMPNCAFHEFSSSNESKSHRNESSNFRPNHNTAEGKNITTISENNNSAEKSPESLSGKNHTTLELYDDYHTEREETDNSTQYGPKWKRYDHKAAEIVVRTHPTTTRD